MKPTITAKRIDFLQSEAEAILANKPIHTELEREQARGILELIELVKYLNKTLTTLVDTRNEEFWSIS